MTPAPCTAARGGGTGKFPRRNLREVPEIQHLFGANEAPFEQRRDIVRVAVLLVGWHQPPQRHAAAEPQRGAIELVEQQVVLGAATVVRTQLRLTLAAGKAHRIDEKEVRLAALAGRPALQQVALAAQFGELRSVQRRLMADPDVQIAALVLRDRAQAAHREQRQDRLWRAVAQRLVGERARQALGLAEQLAVRFEAAEPGRRGGRNVTGQQWVIDMKQQGQQAEHLLLAAGQAEQGTLDARRVDLQEARTQRRQHLAVDAFFQDRLDLWAAGHCRSQSKTGVGLSSAARVPT